MSEFLDTITLSLASTCQLTTPLPKFVGNGLQLVAADKRVLHPGEAARVYCGFRAAFARHFVAFIQGESGIDRDVIIVIPATILPTYRQEWFVTLLNTSNDVLTIGKNQTIAKAFFSPAMLLHTVEVKDLP